MESGFYLFGRFRKFDESRPSLHHYRGRCMDIFDSQCVFSELPYPTCIAQAVGAKGYNLSHRNSCSPSSPKNSKPFSNTTTTFSIQHLKPKKPPTTPPSLPSPLNPHHQNITISLTTFQYTMIQHQHTHPKNPRILISAALDKTRRNPIQIQRQRFRIKQRHHHHHHLQYPTYPNPQATAQLSSIPPGCSTSRAPPSDSPPVSSILLASIKIHRSDTKESPATRSLVSLPSTSWPPPSTRNPKKLLQSSIFILIILSIEYIT